MNISECKKNLGRAIESSIMAKKQVKAALNDLIQNGVKDIPAKEASQLRDLILIAGNDFATMDSMMKEYMSFGRREVAVIEK